MRMGHPGGLSWNRQHNAGERGRARPSERFCVPSPGARTSFVFFPLIAPRSSSALGFLLSESPPPLHCPAGVLAQASSLHSTLLPSPNPQLLCAAAPASLALRCARLERFWLGQESILIYVDQPTGTGFSYSSDSRDTRHNEASVSNDLYDFLQAFFAEHPKYAKNDFYITGEAYAGHYIPTFASRVHQGNKNSEGIHINLKGFAIGNGLTDTTIQYKAYTDYALDMGLITQSQFNRINKIVQTFEFAIKLV